jgi:chloride channel 7
MNSARVPLDACRLCAGGLLFAMEEVASFWNVTLGWQIFFACMTSVFARAFAESLYEGENPGLFSNTITYEVTRKVNTHVLAMGVAVFIGAACGLTAALFTRVNLKWCAAARGCAALCTTAPGCHAFMPCRSQWRARYVGAVKWKRFAEPMVYMFIFSTIAMTLPFAFRCRESGCFIDAGTFTTCSCCS